MMQPTSSKLRNNAGVIAGGLLAVGVVGAGVATQPRQEAVQTVGADVTTYEVHQVYSALQQAETEEERASIFAEKLGVR